MNIQGQAHCVQHSQAETCKGLTLFTAHKKPARATSMQIVEKQHHNLTKVILWR